ncbi:hypothetical protein H0H93_002024 [Arthromyces matolae]|nr:hypothetical protein H0H93_002024 [Arthromyces matolae]
MVNPPNTNSPKGTYAQVTASPKPRVNTTLPTRGINVKVKSDATKSPNGSKTGGENRTEVVTSAFKKASEIAQTNPDENENKTELHAKDETDTTKKHTLVDYASEVSPHKVDSLVDEPNAVATSPRGSLSNRYNNTDLPALPRPKSRKSHRKDKRDAKKLSPSPNKSKELEADRDNTEIGVASRTTTSDSPSIPTKEDDDQSTPKASAAGAQTKPNPQTPVSEVSITSDNLPAPSPPRIPYKAKGKGKDTSHVTDFPHTLLLAQPSSDVNPAVKRKFEDTPTKEKPPMRTVEFKTPKRTTPGNEEPVAYASKTVDAFVHPKAREPVYSDDPEPGVLPEPAYYMETPPFLRYPQDEHLKKLATLMSNKDAFTGDDFDLRKEAVRLQELARETGVNQRTQGSTFFDNMSVDDLMGPANPGNQQGPVNMSVGDQDSVLTSSPTPQPRQRRPVLPNLTRPHSSQGIPIRHLFTGEYQSQYTRSLDTRSPEGSRTSNDFNQNASEASYDSGDISPLLSGEYPGVFQDDFEMRGDSPAPPYQGEAVRDQSPHNPAQQLHPQPPHVPAGTEGANDPLRVWTPSGKPNEVTNIKDVTITARPLNGWPEVFIKYLPLHDLDDKSLATVEMASAPGTCWVAIVKCSYDRMQRLSTIDGIK